MNLPPESGKLFRLGHLISLALLIRPAQLLAQLRRVAGVAPALPATAATLAALLANDDSDDAPEIMPGVVFYHAHVTDVDTPQTFVGVCPKGAQIPHAGQPAAKGAGCISREDEDTEKHGW